MYQQILPAAKNEQLLRAMNASRAYISIISLPDFSENIFYCSDIHLPLHLWSIFRMQKIKIVQF